MPAPQIAAGELLLAAVNAALAELYSLITNFDGANIEDGSVPVSALALGGSEFAIGLGTDRDIFKGTGSGGATVNGVWSWKLPNIAGASNSTWKYRGISVSFAEFTTIHAAGAVLELYKNGVLAHQIDLTAVTAAATPILAYPASSVASSSGDTWSVKFVPGATGDTQYPTVVPYFSVQHVSSG